MKQYKRRKSDAILLALCSVACFAFVFYPTGNPTKRLFVDLVFIGMGALGLYGLVQALVVITLTDFSIVIKYPFLSEHSIRLSDIYSIGDSNASQELVLRDFQGKKITGIGKNIVGILELKQELLRLIAERVRIEPRAYFTKSIGFFISLLMLPVMFAATIILAAYTRTTSLLLLSLFVGSSSYMMYKGGKQIMYVYLSDHAITVKSLFKTTVVSLMEIKDIVVRTDDKTKGSGLTTIVIELKLGKKIPLSGFEPDDEMLFQSCKYYLEHRRGAT